MPRPESFPTLEGGPTLKGGDKWPRGLLHYMLPGLDEASLSHQHRLFEPFSTGGRKMTEETVVQEAAPKNKVTSVNRWVFLSAMLGMLLFTVVMAVYRKFGG